MKRPLSLSGVEIDGESLVRFVYVDESGISIHESVVVVAGVIIHADSQWKAVEKHVGELINKYVAEEDRAGFVFHAAELFHGSGKIFGKRQKYPLERSRQALKEVLSIPSKFHLPVVVGFIRKEPNSPKESKESRRVSVALDQSLAFSLCAMGAERFMRKLPYPHEVATIIAENNTETKKIVKEMHDTLRGMHPTRAEFLKSTSTRWKFGPNFLPLTKLVDTVHFAEKTDAFLLQIADACATLIRYYIEEKPNIEEFLTAFTPSDPADRIMSKEDMRKSGGGMCEVRCWD